MGGDGERLLAPRLLRPVERRRLALAYRRLLPSADVVEPRLAAVLADLRDHPGSLTRGQLAWGLLVRLGAGELVARDVAVALECFHSASLVFDDLPAMDDAERRRGRSCPHRAWGEGPAILGGLALITRGYELLWGALSPLPAERRRRAAALVADCLGSRGVLAGQARDLAFDAARSGPAEVLAVARGKTVPLVRLPLLLAGIVGGASAEALAALESLAVAWGLAYQIVDDAKDALLSPAAAGKSTRRDDALGRPNLPAVAGWAASLSHLDRLLLGARRALLDLRRAGLGWRGLDRLQRHLEGESATVRVRSLAARAHACA